MLLYLFTILIALTPTIEGIAEPTKICGNDDCSEKLFTAVATRDYPPTHEEFINVKINDTITVYAIKFSNRPDIAEGTNGEGIRGKFYITYVEREAYFYFLSHVVKNNVEMSEVYQSSIPGIPKLVKKHPANPYLWRDYKVRATELGEEVQVEMAQDPNEKKPHHHHHHHGHDHHGHHHGHDHSHHDHDHSHEHKELPKTEEIKKETVPNVASTEQNAAPLVLDPLKKISLDAIKGIQKDVPKPEAPVEQVQQQPNPADVHNHPHLNQAAHNLHPNDNTIDSNIVVEKAVELKEELHIASDMVNSIIDEIASPSHENNKIDSVHMVKHEEEKKENIPLTENPTVAEIPTSTLPSVPTHPPKVEMPHHEVPVTPVPLKAEPTMLNAPIETSTLPPLSAEVPTLPPKPAEEPKIQAPVEVPTVSPIVETPTTTPPPAADIPTTIHTPIEVPTTTHAPIKIPTLPPQPIEIPTTTIQTPVEIPTQSSMPLDLPITTTPSSIEEPVVTPLSVEGIPPTTTPIPKEEAATSSSPELIHEPAPGPALSVLQDEIRERRPLNEDSEYCYKNDCSGVADINSTGFIATTIRPFLKSFSSGFRSFMPYPLSEFDDTGAFVFVFFIVTTFMYFISWLFSESGRPDVLDRRALHDSLTKIKEQEVQIEQLKRNASDPAVTAQYGKEIERLRKEKSDIENRLHMMEQKTQQLVHEYQEAHQEKQRLQNGNHQLIAEKAELQNKFDNVFTEKEDLAKELSLVRSQLVEANERQSNSVAQNQESRKLINELESEVNELQSKNSSLQIELDTLNTKCEQLEKQNDNLKMSEAGCMDLIRELEEKLKTAEAKIAKMFKGKKDGTDETGSGESNASNGWSDMDIGDLEASEDVKEEEEDTTSTTEVETGKPVKPSKPAKVATLGKKDSKATAAATKEKESSPQQQRKESLQAEKTRASSIDIYEVVNLKSELRKLEAEREDIKRELANEQRNRESVEQQLDQLKKTLAEKKSDLEQTAKDKDYFRTQSEALSQRVAEYTQKIERLQEDREKVFVLEKDILVLSKEKEEALSKIKDLEKAVRKAEEQSTKLETRYFHEERRLKEQMYKLEEQLTKSKIATIALENAGSCNSSERGDFLSAARNNAYVPSLWSDLDGPETSFDDSPLEVKRESRRRSTREQYQQPLESGRRSVGRREEPSAHRGKNNPRYRSRSAGRQRQSGAPSPYLTGSSGLPAPPHGSSRASPTNYYEHSDRATEIRRSTGRLSRNGQQNYYSSDGSGPLSPPPQIASRSEMKPNILLHKPAPLKTAPKYRN